MPGMVHDISDLTEMSSDNAVHSTQFANLTLTSEQLNEIWSAGYMERLARTYWRFLTRISLGLIRVHYTPQERSVVFLTRPFVLLRFYAPEYELTERYGMVQWRIKSGVLVSKRGRDRDGYLKIAVVKPLRETGVETNTAKITVEVANFYPAIATAISTRLYMFTQSKIHVVVTRRFLRSLANLKLAESRIGNFKRDVD